MRKDEWIKVYSSADFFKAEIVKQVLIEYDIAAVLMDKQGFPYKIGQVEVYVNQADFQRANEIIINNDL